MPEMNGWELCQTLRTLPSTKAVPFLFLSSLDQAPDKLLALRLGADDYLTKPFHLADILAKVQQLIGRVDQREKVLGGAEEAAAGAGSRACSSTPSSSCGRRKRTGVISVNAGPFKGLIYMENGMLKHAVLGRKRGEAALLAMLRLPESQVVFKEGSYPNLPANVKIPWGEFMASLLERGGEGSPRHDAGRIPLRPGLPRAPDAARAPRVPAAAAAASSTTSRPAGCWGA